MCACYNATYGGDTSYRDPCGTEFYALCTNSAPLPPWDSEKTTRLCESCAQGLDSVDCVQNMAGWFSTGACGYPSEMPDFSSCKVFIIIDLMRIVLFRLESRGSCHVEFVHIHFAYCDNDHWILHLQTEGRTSTAARDII